MSKEDNIFFSLLKKEIAATVMQSYPGMNPEISDWKGQDITDFQEDLLIKVNGQLSEKWFYTHMKVSNPSLPRIDVLNILSQYAGYKNRDDFRFKNQGQISSAKRLEKTNNILIRIPLLFLTVMILIFMLIKIINTQNYRLTFIDADTGDPILSSNIRVDLLLENESPVTYTSDEEGGIVIRTNQSKIRMVIKTPYYITDTITRVLKKFNHAEQLSLSADPYALMIHYFSQTDVMAWQKRRDQLNRMISEDAMFYQIPDKKGVPGMELYNKQEFIDKLTMPSSSLRQIDILDCRYSNGQIAILRFRIKTD
ncbi:MAG TPA: hypothetical protein VMV77_10425 [Bacteroidales bacterium]|nr:hypothetical protein [Bacteroidales bacterium]